MPSLCGSGIAGCQALSLCYQFSGSILVSERLEDCWIIADRRFWQVPHTFQGRKMSTLEVGPVLQTSRLANLQTSFTSLLQTNCFLYRADDGLSRSPWSPSTWSFFFRNFGAGGLQWYCSAIIVVCAMPRIRGHHGASLNSLIGWVAEAPPPRQLGRTCLSQTRTTFEALPRILGMLRMCGKGKFRTLLEDPKSKHLQIQWMTKINVSTWVWWVTDFPKRESDWMTQTKCTPDAHEQQIFSRARHAWG